MKAGELVPDTMILRLIVNELKIRGCVEADHHHRRTYTLNSSAGIDADITNAVDSASPFLDATYDVTRESFVYSDQPGSSFILDGFPRNADQAGMVDQVVPMNLVVNLVTPTDVILDRICNRWVHEPSNRVYNTTFNAPKVPGRDDITGEPLTRRADDDPDVWRARLAGFAASVQPLLEHYDRRGTLVTVTGNSSDEITPKLVEEIEARFCVA